MPDAYFKALGYASLDEFDSNSYSVTTEDGQATSPSITKQDGGLLINLGVQHYSAPEPAITFAAKGSPLSGGQSLSPTQKISVSAPSSSASSAGILTPVLSRKKSANLSSIISYRGVGIKAWKISGGCTISGMYVKAPAKRGSCVLSLSVRNSKKKIVYTKKTTIQIL
jgi:hypothetical protein